MLHVFILAVNYLVFLLLQAKDVDKSSEISYRIIGGNVNDLFSIDSHTGEITVSDPHGLDTTNVTNDHIELLIQVSLFESLIKMCLIIVRMPKILVALKS